MIICLVCLEYTPNGKRAGDGGYLPAHAAPVMCSTAEKIKKASLKRFQENLQSSITKEKQTKTKLLTNKSVCYKIKLQTQEGAGT